MKATQTTENIPYPNGLTFEKVWAMFQETDKKFQETREQMKETDRRMKESDRDMKELREIQKETAREIKETSKQIGKLGNRFGELVEHLVIPGIREKFNELNFYFTRESFDVVIKDRYDPQLGTEVDILLEDGDIVVAVEVKARPTVTDIKDHVKRLEFLRRTAYQRGDTRKYRGAVAGAIMKESLRNHIIRTGFYVIEQTGDTMKLTIPEGFIPREW